MKTVVFANRKGGVGKTTLSRMFATFCARPDLAKKRVLMIDADSQASLSKLLIPMETRPRGGTIPPIHPDHDPQNPDPDFPETYNGRTSTGDIFYSGFVVPYPAVSPEGVQLDVIPAVQELLRTVESKTPEDLVDQVYNRLRQWIDDESETLEELYDLIVIDLGPNYSAITIAALRAATHVVIPVEPTQQSVDGLSEMVALWVEESESRPPDRPLDLAGIVINKYDSRLTDAQIHTSALVNDEHLAPLIIPTILYRRASILERDTRGTQPETVFDLPESNDGRKMSLDFCRELYRRIVPEDAERVCKRKPKPMKESVNPYRVAVHSQKGPAALAETLE